MKTKTYNVDIELTEPCLATSPANRDLLSEYIADNAPTEEKKKEEIESIGEQIQKATTVFPVQDGKLFVWDYQLKGYLKEAIGILIELGEFKKLSKWTFKRAIDACVFVAPRRVFIMGKDGKPKSKPDGVVERPLRATTMQGDRVALARSEMVEAGSKLAFQIALLESTSTKSNFAEVDEAAIKACLDYGKLRGFSQWRNASYGRFLVKRFEVEK